MPMVTPTLNLPKPAVSSSAAAKPAVVVPPPPPVATAAAPTQVPDVPGTTVTLSPQAMSALAAAGQAAGTPAAAAPDGCGYESLKRGISTAARDVGEAVSDGAHAVVDGVESTLTLANKLAKGVLELPFAAVSKGCDAVGGLIDEL